MTKIRVDISMSLDGYVAGPNPTSGEPLGRDGERLHEWAVKGAAWREAHGMSGGEQDADSDVIAEGLAATGAVVMGRRMFSGGEGSWEDDSNAGGWWGAEPPFRVPVFVLTHHPREPVEFQNGTTFTFVTDGIEVALEHARAAAGERDVLIAGGAEAVQGALRAGAVDELQVHVAPVLLGGGTHLFGELEATVALERTRVIDSPAATHIRYRVVKDG